MLAQIWADVLQVDQVGVEDDFFELGGHSLLGTRVMARVRDQFEVDLPLRVLFEATSTVRDLAARIEAARREQQGLQLPPLVSRGEYAGELPLSFTQERLWFLEQLESLGGTYNESLALSFAGGSGYRGPAEEPQELVHRHESLRTCIRVACRTAKGCRWSTRRWDVPSGATRWRTWSRSNAEAEAHGWCRKSCSDLSICRESRVPRVDAEVDAQAAHCCWSSYITSSSDGSTLGV